MTAGRTTLQPAGRRNITLVRVVRSESLKFMSLRASVITLLAFAPVSVAFVLLDAPYKVDFLGADSAGNLDLLTTVITSAAPIGWLLVVVVSVLAISGEYATGQIGSTLTVLPRRSVMLLGKLIALGLLVWVVVFIGTALPTAVAWPILAETGRLPGIGEVVSAVLATAAGTATGAMLLGLIALCIGGVLRSAAFSIACAFGLILVLPNLVGLAPIGWLRDLAPFTPTSAAQVLSGQSSEVLSPLGAALVLGGAVIVGCVVWAVTLLRRDV